MRSIVYSRSGSVDVLRLVERDLPEPGPDEVRVWVAVSGVNPTDWKSRANGPVGFAEVTPNQDGAGTLGSQDDSPTGSEGQAPTKHTVSWPCTRSNNHSLRFRNG
jgi:NADPH2:quinone reductase